MLYNHLNDCGSQRYYGKNEGQVNKYKDSYNTGGCPPLSYMMHTRAERKVLPYRQPARGAAARSASLEFILKAARIGFCRYAL